MAAVLPIHTLLGVIVPYVIYIYSILYSNGHALTSRPQFLRKPYEITEQPLFLLPAEILGLAPQAPQLMAGGLLMAGQVKGCVCLHAQISACI